MREMKDSGIEWIGLIPQDWDIVKSKYICNEIFSGGTPSSTNMKFWDGEIPWIPSGACHNSRINSFSKTITELGLNSSSTKMIPQNTVLMAMTGATCGNTGYLTFKSCANQSVMAFIENGNVYKSLYLWYVLMAANNYIMSLPLGGAQSGINLFDCENIHLPLPNIQQQQKIAFFLDKECSELDSLTSDIEKQIQLLEDYKKSIITEAVTKGINPNVEMKDSGSKIWGDIPCHWECKDVKYIFEIVKRIAGKEGIDVLSVTQKGLKIKDITKNEGQLAESYKNYQLVYKNDYVMNHMDLLNDLSES